MFIKLAMWIMHRKYKKMPYVYLTIKGTDKDEGKFLIYTENKDSAKTLEEGFNKRWQL